MTSVLGKNVYISNNTFADNSNIVSVDLCNLPFVNNSMHEAFLNCSNLINVIGINKNITNMYDTFYRCYNLVNAPIIPNNVTSLHRTFSQCNSLVNAPTIPNIVTDMGGTFGSCISLVNAPVIPNSVISMDYTFNQCYSLINAPVIPNSVQNLYYAFHACNNLVIGPDMMNASNVTNMYETFSGCTNLSGNIYIQSNKITGAIRCFYGTSLTKNVYIPFTYDNGVNTKTYNSFITAGYGTNTYLHGVHLKDINNNVDLSNWTYTQNNNVVTLTGYTGSDMNIVVPEIENR